jgi:predicted Holliday junction resolvase-like endonuclease
MKPHNIQTLITAIVLILLLVVIAVSMIKLRAMDKQVESLTQANGVLQNENTTYKHVNGKLLAENQAAELRAEELKKSLPALAEALTKQMDIKMRNLRAGVVAEIRATGSGNASIGRIPFDTTGRFHPDPGFIYDSINNHLNLLDSNFEPFALTIDDGYLGAQIDVYNEFKAPYLYTYSDTIKFAFHMKRPKWHQRKQLYVSGSLANPNATVLRSQGVLVNEFKQKRFGIGPSVSWGMGPDLKPQTTIGLSLHWSWIRF